MPTKKHCTIYRNEKGELSVNCAKVSFDEIIEAEKEFLEKEKEHKSVGALSIFSGDYPVTDPFHSLCKKGCGREVPFEGMNCFRCSSKNNLI